MKKYIYNIKRLVKHILAYSLYYSGVLLLIKYIVLKNKVIVLTYHRVLPYDLRSQSFSHAAIMVDPDRFDRQLSFIKRHFNIINSTTLINIFENNIQPQCSSCLITFDDGWEDNYIYAFPILRKHSLTALIFTATDYVDGKELFWQEAMGHGIRQLLALHSDESKRFLIKHNLYDLIHIRNDNRTDLIRDYVRKLKSMTYAELDDMLRDIASILGEIDYADVDSFMSWSQIKEMHNNGIEFGSHACSHKILTRLEDQVVKIELTKSKQLLHDILTDEIDTIAYPNGNYNPHLGELTQAAGYRIGFGTNHGYVSPSDDKFNLKRININDTTATNRPIMLATILGIF